MTPTNFARAIKSSVCPFCTCKPPTFSVYKKMWFQVWNSSPNNLVASFLSTSFLRFTTSYQSFVSRQHVKILSTLGALVFKLLWLSENPIEHELWHICFLSFPMRYNIGYLSVKFVALNTYQSITPFDWLKCLSIVLLHEHMHDFFEYLV
jgi:hypothetical protein